MSIVHENNERNELMKLRKQKVVEHNDLITSVAKMDRVPLKIFELAVSHIDEDNLPENNTISLSKKTLFTFFGVEDTNKNSRFKAAIHEMQKQAYFEIKVVEGKGFKYKSILPIPFIEWNDYNDKVTIRFDEAIMPYLVDLKTNFTQYLISDIIDMKSKYSVILYKWLSMNFNQYEHYEHSPNRTKKQLDYYKNPIISIDELRRITDTEHEYERFQSLEKRVIQKATEEISELTHYKVTYEKIKKGKFIVALKFHIEKKPTAPNLHYKEEQQDPQYLATKELKEEEKTQIFLKAQKSVYTENLISIGLLEFSDVLDRDLMIEMFNSVFPKYDELVQLRHEKEVTRHLSYVKEHQEDYSKINKPKYLRTAIEDYLKTVRFQEGITKSRT